MSSKTLAPQDIFLADIIKNPMNPVTWLVGADAYEDTAGENATSTAMRLVGGARQGVMPAEPLCLLPGLRRLFDIEHNEPGYARYLQTAGFLTKNELTSLQGDLLLDHLQNGGANRDELMRCIRERIRALPGLEAIPDDRVTEDKGRVNLDLITSPIANLPPGFHISGNAVFWNCDMLASIGNAFHAGNYAKFQHCGALRSIGDGFASKGALFEHCTAPMSIGDNFYASHGADFSYDNAVKSIGANFHTDGDATFSNSRRLESIGANFYAGGHAYFSGCTILKSIGDGFYAGQNADFENCGALTEIGAGFHAGHFAIFHDCSALESIGKDFHARWDGYFSHCGSLRSIGSGFRIDSDVNFFRCHALRSFPADIAIRSRIKGLPHSFPDEALKISYPNLSQTAKLSLREVLEARTPAAGQAV